MFLSLINMSGRKNCMLLKTQSNLNVVFYITQFFGCFVKLKEEIPEGR